MVFSSASHLSYSRRYDSRRGPVADAALSIGGLESRLRRTLLRLPLRAVTTPAVVASPTA